MKTKENIFTEEWCDIIFENKNKDYGACANRKSSSRNHLIAIIATGTFFSLSICFPLLMKGNANKDVIKISEGTLVSGVYKEEPIFIPEPMKKVLPKLNAFKPEVLGPNIILGNEETTFLETPIKNNSNTGLRNDTANFSNQNNIQKETNLLPEKIDPVFFVEVMPEFPGGELEMMAFLGKNIKYPQDARELGIQGKVYVVFVVNTDGSISDIKISRGVFSSCDREAMRVVQSMPKWKPGKQNGTAVPVYFNLPISYVLK